MRGPTIKDDLVLVSEYEPSKAVLERINDDAFVVRGPGEYECKGIAVRGVQSWADSQQGKELGLSTIYCVVAEELLVCHLGATGQGKLTDEQMEEIGDPDILIIPVGGQSALDAKAATEIITQIEPKIIIPIQYHVDGAAYEADKLEKFVKEIGLPVEKMDSLRMAKKLLPVDQSRLVVLAA